MKKQKNGSKPENVAQEEQLMDCGKSQIRLFQRKILSWYKKSRREMPWREQPTPYRIWISEIMLQQTRVDTVIPYFNNFMARYPTVESLASSEENELMKYWEGLGYYSRIKNIRKTAIELVQNHQAKLPESFEELLKLKGIGEYTAGAIASEAFGEKVPAVDGNVFRVFARLTGFREDIREAKSQEKLKVAVRGVLPEKEIGDFNQGLIELGALICIPKGSPKCELCPVKEFCGSYRDNLQDEIPFRSKARKRTVQERTVFLIQCGDRFAVRKREEGTLLEGLFEIPNREGFYTPEEAKSVVEEMGFTVKDLHMIRDKKVVFTHIEWILQGYYFHVAEENDAFLFETKENLLKNYALASAFIGYLDLMEGPQQLSFGL